MLQTHMAETAFNTVKISDFDGEVVKGMLEYVYTARTEVMDERASDLLKIADKYDLQGLKDDCQHAISQNVNVNNAAETLVLADRYNALLLKQWVVNFIKRCVFLTVV